MNKHTTSSTTNCKPYSYQKARSLDGVPIPDRRHVGRTALFALLLFVLSLAVWVAHPKRDFRVQQDIPDAKTLRLVVRELKRKNVDVWTPDRTGFWNVAAVWTKRQAAPQLVLSAQSVADVQIAVATLYKYNVSFRIRSGGHHKAGYSTVPNGVVLSLTYMNQTQPPRIVSHTDRDAAVLKMGPGVTVHQYLRQVFAETGYAGVLGFCGSVGEGGFVLGGGFGMQSRLYGLGMDSIRSFQVVLYDGTLVTASQKQNSDLFWALRGAGGGSFGVVVEMEYRVYSASDAVLVGLLQMERYNQLAELLYDIGRRNLPGNICVMQDDRLRLAIFWSGRNLLELQYGKSYVEDLMTQVRPTNSNVTYYNISWIETMGGGDDSPTVGWGDSVWGASCWCGFLMPVNNTKQVWQEIMAILQEGLAESQYLLPDIELWGGAISRHSSNATAFPHRSAVYNVCVLLMIPENIDDPERVFQKESAQVNKWWPKVETFLQGSYVNYPNLYLLDNTEAHHFARVQWGDNLSRLVKVKNQYDPENVFRFPMSVPTSLS